MESESGETKVVCVVPTYTYTPSILYAILHTCITGKNAKSLGILSRVLSLFFPFLLSRFSFLTIFFFFSSPICMCLPAATARFNDVGGKTPVCARVSSS